jgi:hypothetical protein
MGKVWKAGDKIPIEYINALERKAESYDRMLAEESQSTVDKAKAKPSGGNKE